MKIKYINELGQSIDFKYSRPFCLESIEGLGFENNINLMKTNGFDGSTIINNSVNEREITITATLITTTKIQINRMKRQLLKVFNPKLQGEIIVSKKGITDKKNRCKVQNIIWGKETILTQQFIIRLLCPSPFFTDIDEIKTQIAYWNKEFHFPLELRASGIEMGYRSESLIVNVENKGDVSTGMRIRFIAHGSLKKPSLFNINTREFISINIDMQAGDIITITTQKGYKKVELFDTSGVRTNIFNRLDLDSTFLQLDVGDNLFRYNADENINNLEVNIYHTAKYLGC